MWRSSCRSRLKCVTINILIVRTHSYKKHNFYTTKLKLKIYNLPKEGI